MELDSTKVIRAVFESQPSVPYTALSVYRDTSYLNQRLAAVGCSTHVSVTRLDREISELFSLSLRSTVTQKYSITDVCWNHLDPGRLAVSSTTGIVAVFGCEVTNPTVHFAPVSPFPSPVMNSAAGGRALSANDLSGAASALQGQGTTISRKQEWDSSAGEPPSRVNKLCWSHRDKHILASACQDGMVRVFDTRANKPALELVLRAVDAVRDVQFDPFASHNALSSLAENGLCCLWDCRQADAPVSKFSAHASGGLCVAYHPTQPGIMATGSRDKSCRIWNVNSMASDTTGAPLKPLQVLHTSSAVGRIRWRGLHKFEYHLATTSAADRGDVSVWNLMLPRLPGCVLRGHSDACADFEFLDSQLPSSESAWDLSAKQPSQMLQVNQHILSVGKDGRMLVQDMRNGYFPRKHISPSVTAISAKGDVAFQRAEVIREDNLGICSDERTSHAASWMADVPSHFGSVFGRYSADYFSSNEDSRAFTPSTSTSSSVEASGDKPQAGEGGKLLAPGSPRGASGPGARLAAATPSSSSSSSSAASALKKKAGKAVPKEEPTPLSAIAASKINGSVGKDVSAHVATSSASFESKLLAKANEKSIAIHSITGAVGAVISADQSGRTVDSNASTVVATSSAAAASSSSSSSSAAASDNVRRQAMASAAIFIGQATIESLTQAQQINQDHAAEGGVFDPATIKLLAVAYRIQGGVEACEENAAAARAAGLTCRAAVWSTLVALLPKRVAVPVPTSTPSLVAASTPAAPNYSSPSPLSGMILPPNSSSSSSSSSSNGINSASTPGAVGASSPGPDLPAASVAASAAAAPPGPDLTKCLPFTVALIGEVLLDLINCGDCQHFVTACELISEASEVLLSNALASAKISVQRRSEGYYYYTTLLQQLRLFSVSNSIIVQSTLRSSPVFQQQGVRMQFSCAKCGKEIAEAQATPHCQKCNKCTGLCTICHLPVRGLFRWCQVCGHGGHGDCIEKWFAVHDSCATGCGHSCSVSKAAPVAPDSHNRHARAKTARGGKGAKKRRFYPVQSMTVPSTRLDLTRLNI